MNRASRALRAAAVVSAFGYASQALSLVAIPIFLGSIHADGYGLMVTVMALMGYIGFADAGLSWGAMILIAQAQGRGAKDEIAQIVRHGAVLAAASGAVALLLVGGLLACAQLGWRLPMFAGHPEADRLIAISGAQLCLSLQFGIVYNLFQGLQESYWAGLYQGAGRLLGLAGAMTAAWLTRSVEVVMVVQLAFTFVSGAAATWHAWRRHPWAFTRGSCSDSGQYAAQVRIGAKNFLLQVGRTLSATAPTFALSTALGPAAVPFYTIPTTLLSLFFTPINSWNSSLQSAYGESWTAGMRDWTRNAFRGSLERSLMLAALGGAWFLALGDSFVRLWTDNRIFIEPGMALSVSAIVLVSTLLAAGQFLLTGLNRHRSAGLAEVVNGVVALGLTVVAVNWWGASAVGLGILVAALATSGWVLRRDIRLQLGADCFPHWGYLLRVLAVGGAAYAGMHFMMSASSRASAVSTILHLAAAAVVGGVLFLGMALALRLAPLDEVFALGRKLRRHFLLLPT